MRQEKIKMMDMWATSHYSVLEKEKPIPQDRLVSLCRDVFDTFRSSPSRNTQSTPIGGTGAGEPGFMMPWSKQNSTRAWLYSAESACLWTLESVVSGL